MNTLFSQWHQTSGPGGGSIYSLHASGNNLFAGTELGTMHLSTNNGVSWSNLGLIAHQSPIVSIISNNSIVFAASPTDGVFRSIDNGTTWLNSGLINKGVCVLIGDGTNLFAGSDSTGVHISTDNGISWTQVNSGLTDLYVQSLTVGGGYLFAGTQTGVFRSANNGSTWTLVNSGLVGLGFYSIASFGSNLYTGSANGGGVSLSTDNGDNWTQINNGLSNGFGSNGHSALEFAQIGNTIFIATASGIFSTTNNGNSWTLVNTMNTKVKTIAAIGNQLFSGNRSGVSLSVDNGNTWVNVNEGLAAQSITAMAVSEDKVFAGTYFNPMVFSSMDNCLNWSGYNPTLSYLNTYIGDNVINALIVKDEYVFCGVGNTGVLRSNDDGLTWTTVNNGLNFHDVLSLHVKDGAIFAGTSNGGVFLSTDNGGNWTAINSGFPVSFTGDILTAMHAFTVSDGNIFVATGNSNFNGAIYFSSDNGENWVSVSSGLDPQNNFNALVSIGNTLFSGSYSGVFKSTDNGDSWTSVNNGLSALYVKCLAVSGNNLYAGTAGGGVFLSTDNGANWTSINQGLDHLSISTLTVNGNYIYAGTQTGSVFLSTINSLVNELPILNLKNIQVFPNPSNTMMKITGLIGENHITVYNSLGQVIVETEAENDFLLDVTKLEKGVYTMIIKDKNSNVLFKKIMIN